VFYRYVEQVIQQSEHIGQWATPHDRRLGGIGRVVPIGYPTAMINHNKCDFTMSTLMVCCFIKGYPGLNREDVDTLHTMYGEFWSKITKVLFQVL